MEDNFQKQTYRNRTFIAHSNGILMLNIPIKHNKDTQRLKTREVIVENDFPWQDQHWKSLQSAYRTSPFFEYYEDDLLPLFKNSVEGLMEHNLNIFKVLSELIGMDIEVAQTSKYEKDFDGIDLRNLINSKSKSSYCTEPYNQVLNSNHGFLPNLSILDLLFNEGPNTLTYLERQHLNF